MINRNASNPACSVQREASLRASEEAGRKGFLLVTGMQAGPQGGGEVPGGVPSSPPRSPSARLGIQEEMCSKEL